MLGAETTKQIERLLEEAGLTYYPETALDMELWRDEDGITYLACQDIDQMLRYAIDKRRDRLLAEFEERIHKPLTNRENQEIYRMDKSQTDAMTRRFDRISAQEYAPWPVGNWAVEKLTPSGNWVRITPRTSRQEADRYVAECRAKYANCAEMRVI